MEPTTEDEQIHTTNEHENPSRNIMERDDGRSSTAPAGTTTAARLDTIAAQASVTEVFAMEQARELMPLNPEENGREKERKRE